jgi:2'-5' RNA ligase
MPQSAFIVRVPEADPHVARLRERFDPSARLGVPAHVTLLFPFMSPELVTSSILAAVSKLALSVSAFPFRLGPIKRFPGVVYLATEPAAPLVALTRQLAGLFPEFPPYGGDHQEIVPHLTVAQAAEAELAQVEAELLASLASTSISTTCSEFVLIENSSGLWRPMHTFALALLNVTDG